MGSGAAATYAILLAGALVEGSSDVVARVAEENGSNNYIGFQLASVLFELFA